MTWIKLDDQFADHPKLLAVGPLGLALQVSAICYCARHLTDGFMSRVTVRALVAKLSVPWSDERGGDWYAAATSGMAGREASEFDWPTLMVDAGLWDEVDGGYKVHDYEHFNPTKAQVTKQREAWSERQSRSRSRRDTTVNHAPVAPSVTRGVTGVSPSPVPVPDPVPIREEDILSPSAPQPTEEPKPKASRKKPATALPPDADLPTWLAANGIPERHPELAGFIDHHRARDNRFASWSAAWGTWLRNAEKFARGRGGPARHAVQPISSLWEPKRGVEDLPFATPEEGGF